MLASVMATGVTRVYTLCASEVQRARRRSAGEGRGRPRTSDGLRKATVEAATVTAANPISQAARRRGSWVAPVLAALSRANLRRGAMRLLAPRRCVDTRGRGIRSNYRHRSIPKGDQVRSRSPLHKGAVGRLALHGEIRSAARQMTPFIAASGHCLGTDPGAGRARLARNLVRGDVLGNDIVEARHGSDAAACVGKTT